MSIRNHRRPSAGIQRGFSITELLVALTLGILLVGGMIGIYSQTRHSFQQDAMLARMQESARFAIDELTSSTELTGYWSPMQDPVQIQNDDNGTNLVLSVNPDCPPDGWSAPPPWIYDYPRQRPVQHWDNAQAGTTSPNDRFNCIANADHQTGTDILAIKGVEGVCFDSDAAAGTGPDDLPCGDDRTVADMTTNGIYLGTNGGAGLMFQYTGNAAEDSRNTGLATNMPNPPPGEVLTFWRYRPQLFYVRNWTDTAGDGQPCLVQMRLTADAPPQFVENCLIPGVEDFQLEFGQDTDADGTANTYWDNPTNAVLDNVISVRMHLVVRSRQEDAQYTDTKTYTVANRGSRQPNDGFLRRIYTTTVVIRNPNSLQQQLSF